DHDVGRGRKHGKPGEDRRGAETDLDRDQDDRQQSGSQDLRAGAVAPQDADRQDEDRRGDQERTDPVGEMDGDLEGRARPNQPARTTVSSPTAAATSLCPCSNRTPPVIGGKTVPNDSGQSGTASPDPVLVTRPPTARSTTVAPAHAVAYRCRQRSNGAGAT